jgi:hypothetical protein
MAETSKGSQSPAPLWVAAVYQRHEFLSERRQALDLWGTHIGELLKSSRIDLKIVA